MMDEEENGHNPKTCMSQHAMQALYDMRSNNMLCDATIRLDDDYFNVHRAIMCSCSNYFRALFTTSLTGERHDVTIPGIRSSIMDKIIKYAYLRKCKIDDDNVLELLTIADYVGIMGLVKQCVQFLIKSLTPENCVGIMFFARSKFCNDLSSIARKYILSNFVEISIKSKEILKIGLSDFYDIISDDLLNTKDEEQVWNCCVKWIDYDPLNRSCHITKLLRGIRLGLLDAEFFMEKIKDNPYVVNCEETKPIIIQAISFMYDLDIITADENQIKTPGLAIPRLPHEILFAIGGWSEGLPQRCIETYDTRADRWVRVPEEDPAGPRAYHGTAVIGFKIYCIGGFDGMDYFNTCRVFDAVKKTWSEISPMHNRRCYVSVTELNGKIYAMGGYDGQTRQNTAEIYDPKTNQWTMISPMSIQRSDASACTLDGKIYIIGGFNGQECMNSAEYYVPSENAWYPLPNMLTRRSGVSCVAFKGFIYVVGGFNGLSRMNSAERYDPNTQSWSLIQEMYNPRSNFGLEIIDDMIFAIGGFNGVATIAHAECYSIETNEWLEATDMEIVRSALSVNVITGLPNLRDYAHKNRENLMEERRQRLLLNALQIEEIQNHNEENDDNENNNNNYNINNNHLNLRDQNQNNNNQINNPRIIPLPARGVAIGRGIQQQQPQQRRYPTQQQQRHRRQQQQQQQQLNNILNLNRLNRINNIQADILGAERRR